MSDPTGRDAFCAHFGARRAELPGAGLAERRAAALASFVEQGIPSTRHEDWRFTPLRAFSRLPFVCERPRNPPLDGAEAARRAVGESHRIAFLNGVFAPALSDLGALGEGVRVESLAAVLAAQPERVEAVLGRLADPKRRAFTALNAALFEDGAFVEVGASCSLERPIHILNLVCSPDAPLAVHPRHLISVGAGSRVTIVEHSLGAGAQGSFSNPVTEIRIDRDANVEHVMLQEESAGAYHLAALAARQESGSRFASTSLALGSSLARGDIRCELAGEGAHVRLNGLYLGRDAQLLDHHTTIDHATPHTTSEELYKGILDDRAHGVFHGRIHVRPHAQKIDAMQNNRNLLLSDRAAINTKPQLEIHADDVRCSHGAAIGQLDPDHLFYLRSRGLDSDAARALLMFGFAREILRDLPLPELRRHMEQRVLGWLPRESSA